MRDNMELGKILGLAVVHIRGFEGKGKPKKHGRYEPQYILFSDRKTFIELQEQDYYSFHDCSSRARNITLYQDAKRWEDIRGDVSYYPPANTDI